MVRIPLGLLLVLGTLASGASATPERPAAFPSGVPDTLRLADVRRAAAQQDPRAVQPALLVEAAQLRIAAVRAARLPQLTLSSQATWQSDVPEIPIATPTGAVPSPPNDQVRAQLDAEWVLFDAGQTGRRVEAERARLAEDLAGVEVTLNTLREAATSAYFAALLADARRQTFALAVADLDARLGVLARQVAEGAALAADSAALAAEQIGMQQQVDEAEAARRAALAVLADLTRQPMHPTDTLALPALDAEVAATLGALRLDAAAAVARPEVERLTLGADRAQAEASARVARTRPTVSLFGQAGVGRPSPYDFLADDVAEYGLVGLRLRWSLFDGGRARREAAALRVQAQVAEAEAAALRRQFARAIAEDRATLARLDAALAADARVVALREQALGVAARQLEEGVILADIYARRLSDLARARLTRARHRIERAHAQARLLSTLGRFPDTPIAPR